MCLNPFMPRRKETTKNLVGALLRKYREAKNISQDGLAVKLQLLGWDVTRMTITRIESRNRLVSDFEIYILATALEVNPKDLMPDSPSLDIFLKEDVREKFRAKIEAAKAKKNQRPTDKSKGPEVS
jgi:transcriptional regulator with XRE-family HTH domain